MIMCNKTFVNYVPIFHISGIFLLLHMLMPSAIGWVKGLYSHLSPIETGLGETMWDC